ILFNHTQSGDHHYYFVVNTLDTAGDYNLTFRVKGKQPEIWDPMNGQIKKATSWKQQEKGTSVNITLPAYGSCFVVFKENTTNTGLDGKKDVPETVDTLSGPWKIEFDSVYGPKKAIITDSLFSWNHHLVEDIKYYSGTATYSTTFNLESIPEGKIALDLGKVASMARIRINGKELPLDWHAPFIFNISKALVLGENTLEIDVTNSWHNRLVGDCRLEQPVDGLPGWLLNGNSLPYDSKRKTWVFFEHQKPNDKLFPAGLIGPVRICKVMEKKYQGRK
ncbi:MAG: hypothetical protein MI892_13670, partial [Desulfobacterales bacterium]|nr:hypothetical protein [Desulfobacterales bacterium]